MVLGSPAGNATDKLVFWSGPETTITADNHAPSHDSIGDDEEDISMPESEKGESMYVTLFEDMLRTVLLYESHLFPPEEIACMMTYSRFSYRGRYLFIRLCLRKSDSWFRLNKLKYQTELGNHLVNTIAELCGSSTTMSRSSPPHAEVKIEERDVIDLTGDSEDERTVPEPCKPSEEEPGLHQVAPSLAEDETHADLRSLLECLGLAELKAIAKQMKLKTSGPGARRDDLINALLSSSSTQSTLPFTSKTSLSTKGKGTGKLHSFTQTTLTFGSRKTQADRLREIVTKHLGKCIKIKGHVIKIFRRVNLIYFRNTQFTTSLLTPSILSRANKRSYASYKYTRTKMIWPERNTLLAYEEALELEAEVDALLEGPGTGTVVSRGRSATSKTPGPSTHGLKTPVRPKAGDGSDGDVCRGTRSSTKARTKENSDMHPDTLDEDLGDSSSDSRRKQNARLVKDIFDLVYPRWQDMMKVKGEEGGRTQGLERFECGHILTRVVCKGTYALGVLKDYTKELEVLEELLSQRRWRRGRRGRWHERRALILMTHLGKGEKIYRRALEAVTEALIDDDTHVVFRPKLERRLTTLEKRLKIPETERHVCEGKLDKAEQIYISGVRVYHRATSLLLDRSCRVNKLMGDKSGLTQTSLPWSLELEESPQKPSTDIKDNTVQKSTGKSIWIGRGDEEVNVETLALQYYEDQNYKGFHCEGRIVTTLFGLLFWDVIFADIPGAFETPYQSAPLDIAEDTFYFSRKDLADNLLDKINSGFAERILERVYDEHAEKKTWCVGVRWDIFQKDDLKEIVRCLGGPALAVICRLLCEDYASRVGGVPDLIIWQAETGKCKFVEVKGPGDKLQENQKVWIDVLLQAGIEVEICHVFEKGSNPPKSQKGKNNKGKRKRPSSDTDSEGPMVESEDESEIDYSQLDKGADVGEEGMLPVTPKKCPDRKANRMEVVITSSPTDMSRSPRKKRRVLSPEV